MSAKPMKIKTYYRCRCCGKIEETLKVMNWHMTMHHIERIIGNEEDYNNDKLSERKQ